MNNNYLELKAESESLLAQAEQVRQQELAAVIQIIKSKMTQYGLTVADLGGPVSDKNNLEKSKRRTPTKYAKYRGPNGELWAGGPGRKPQWVVNILAEGKSLDDFLI